jgi:formylglycine-generating enzyme required for sulfatase activity
LGAYVWFALACQHEAATHGSVAAAGGGGSDSHATTLSGRDNPSDAAAGRSAAPTSVPDAALVPADAGNTPRPDAEASAVDASAHTAQPADSSAAASGDDLDGGHPAPSACDPGSCAPVPPSCASLTLGCGPSAGADCCRSLHVPGGTFLRLDDPLSPATVSDFYLDEFEVSVGRFRAFLNAYPQSLPRAGAGAHPRIAGTGWKTDDDEDLSYTLGSLFAVGPHAVERDALSSWGDMDSFVVGVENLPANRQSWLMAFAFCAWDGGRLPTEAEWNYAASGGAEQRRYPWGMQAPNPTLGAVVCTADATAHCIQPVGSHPAGNARWGQADMAGNVREWTLDFLAPLLPLPCIDCARLEPIISPRVGGPPIGSPTIQTGRVLRGGAFGCAGPNIDSCTTSFRDHEITYSIANGFRCARDRVSPAHENPITTGGTLSKRR